MYLSKIRFPSEFVGMNLDVSQCFKCELAQVKFGSDLR